MTTDQRRTQTQRHNDTRTIAEWIELILDAMNAEDISHAHSRLASAEEAIETAITHRDGEQWFEGETSANLQRCMTAMERILQRDYGDQWEFHIWGTHAGGFEFTINHDLSRTEQRHAAKNKPDGTGVMKWFGCVLVNSPSRSPRNYDPELSSGPNARRAVDTFDSYQDARQWYDQYEANVALVPYDFAAPEKRGFLAMKTRERVPGRYAW